MKKTRAIAFLLQRYLISSWANKKLRRHGSAIGILLPIFGVTIGVFAFIVVLSIMGGFVTNIRSNLLEMQAHIEIVSQVRAQQIPATPELKKLIQKTSSSVLNVSPFQGGDIIIQANNRGVMASIKGIDTQDADSVLNLSHHLSSGASLKQLNKKLKVKNIKNSVLFPTVFMGGDLMDQLGVSVGDSVTLVSTEADDGPAGLAPTQFPVVVAGSLNSGNFSLDKKLVVSSLSTVNQFFQNKNTWLGLMLKLKDPMQSDQVASLLNHYLIPKKLIAKPWTETNGALLKALKLEHYGMSFVMVMIILVGCFSISISLLLSVRRKSKEMAILRSLGLEQSDLCRLYLWQGFLIGFFGILLGLLLGFSTLYYVHHYTIPFITSPYSSSPLPVVIAFWDILFVVFGSLILAMVASVWPAIEVKNLDIVEILSIRN